MYRLILTLDEKFMKNMHGNLNVRGETYPKTQAAPPLSKNHHNQTPLTPSATVARFSHSKGLKGTCVWS
ncbi:hypothetical protein LWI29_001191 [Acer saccharum]|uniref:Uncharacterized protein n=1 Tax=Acer saccharum TaxID=4024 RepID=A0AA39SWZ6_ACESA|nr:hypothetical protein LWI29_001191 [Acer saccharum]